MTELTEVLVSEPVVIWVPASESDQQRGRKEEHIANALTSSLKSDDKP